MRRHEIERPTGATLTGYRLQTTDYRLLQLAALPHCEDIPDE